MIGFMPELHPDELVYSWLARYHVRSGHDAHIYSIKELINNPRQRLEIEFLNKYTDEIYSILTNTDSIENVIMNHTMFTAYAMFLLPDRRKEVLKSLMKMDGKHRSIRGMNIGQTNRYMKYCPLCAAEDRKSYGETYWHVDWEIEAVNICPTHRCYLNETDTILTGNKREAFLFVIAEEVIPEQDSISECHNSLELKLSQYIIDVLHTKIDIENMTLIGEFMHSKLVGTKYITPRGKVRKLQVLYDDLEVFYKNTHFKIPTKMNIQEIFLNKNYDLLHICMLALFLNISPEEIVNRKLPSKSYAELFDERVQELYNNGMTFKKIAKELNASEGVVKLSYHGNYKMRDTKHVKRNNFKYDWKKIDKDTLSDVKIAVEKVYNGNYLNEKPHRVTVYGIEKMLGFSQKAFKNLPLCTAEIKKYEESYPEYWAREVVWYVEHMKKEHITLTDIKLRTNIRDNQLIQCLPYLCKYTDKETANMVKRLVKL